MQLDVGGVEDALHGQRSSGWIETACQSVDGGAETKEVAQGEQARQWRAESLQRQIRQAMLIQMDGGLLWGAGHWQAKLWQKLIAVDPVGGMGGATVEQGADALVGQQQRCQQVPGVVFLLARIAGPVQVHVGQAFQRLVANRAAGIQKTGQLFRGFFLHP